MKPPSYPPEAVQPMRDETTVVGFQELLSAEDVEREVVQSKGTVFAFINSVCGCAAGGARPGLAAALQNDRIPDKLVTAFAGMEHEAVQRLRELHAPVPPSSPCMILFKDGRAAIVIPRSEIEGRPPQMIAEGLRNLFSEHCTRPGPSIPPSEFAKLEFAKVCGSSIPRIH